MHPATPAPPGSRSHPRRHAAVVSLLATIVAALAAAVPSAAEDLLPAGPIRAFDGRVVLGGEVVATAGGSDNTAFFNYTDYEQNALRTFRASLAGTWRIAPRVALVGEVRSLDLDRITPYAAYVRVRPWAGRRLDVQAGRIPPAFGAFGRRIYANDHLFVGYPLAWQYLTSLRPDAAPATADDILRMRGRGWLSSFPVGNPAPAPGVPLITAFRWDTGIQAHWASDRVAVTGAVTTGTLSNPRVADDNGGKQVSMRVSARPVTGLVAGASAARGDWLSREVTRLVPAQAAARDHVQQAFGLDVEYSRGYWLVRSEAIWSRWDVPLAATGARLPLSARAVSVEGRYRIRPRLYAAARVDGLGFSRIAGTLFEGRPTTWDAPVSRVEVAGGYYLQRNVVARVAIQHNRRDGGRVHRRTFLAAQLAWWF
jgi:hypothetical protein